MEEKNEMICKDWCDMTPIDYLNDICYLVLNEFDSLVDKDLWESYFRGVKKALEESEEIKKKIKALDKALDLLKQKRDNAQRDLENIDVVSYIERINKIEAYTDCIATIEAELGRLKGE